MSIFKNKGSDKKPVEYNYNYTYNIDCDTLTESIIKAYKSIEKEKEDAERDKVKEWQKVIGYKEAPENLSKTKKWCFKKINDFTVFLRILFGVKRKDIKTFIINNGLMKLFLNFAYSALEVLLYAFSIILFITFIFNRSYETFILFAGLSFLCLVFARIFRIASFEVERIKDNNYLIGLFSAITSFIAMIAAIIAIFLEVKT